MRLPTMVVPPTTSKDFNPVLNNILKIIVQGVNQVEFGQPLSGAENVWCDFVTIQTTTAHKCVSAAHALSAVPHSMICVWQDTGGAWYKPTDATSADTKTQLFAICTTASSAVMLIF